MSKFFTLKLLLVLLFFGDWAKAQSIWPGDVNNNGVVNCVDILYWAVANEKSGPARSAVGTSWQAYAMPSPWNWKFPGANGMNYAYADTDGNGKIDRLDPVYAIEFNFWKTHGAVTPDIASQILQEGVLSLHLKPNKQTAAGGETITVDVELNKKEAASLQVTGIAFVIEYNTQLVVPNSFKYEKVNLTPLGSHVIYNLGKNDPQRGVIEIATVVTNGDNYTRTSPGKFGKFSFKLADRQDTKDLNFTIKNVYLIDKDLNLLSLSVHNTKVTVNNGSSGNDDDDDDDEPRNCPNLVDPVCGSDGKTYLNSCYAEKAGVSYTPGVCNTDCVDPSRINPNTNCPEIYQPVCGCNGETYSNACEAEAAGVKSYTTGPCKDNSVCYDPNYVLTAAYTEVNNNTGVIVFSTPQDNDPVCGCNGITYKNSFVAEANGITFYTKGKCSTNCVDPAQMDPNAVCTKEYEPVCGCNGVTYSNACVAEAAGVVSYTPGACGGNTSTWCSKATTLDCGNFLSNESTNNAGNHISSYPCANKNYNGPEKVYIINKTSAGDLQIGLEILTANLDLDLFLLKPDCSKVTCLKSSTTSNTQTNNEGIVLEDAPTGTYYLVVDGPAAGNFRLELSCGYLYCGDAIALTCGQAYNGKNNNGQDNVSLYSCSEGVFNVENNGPEKVHTFTLVQASEVGISLTNLSANLELFLLKDCDRGSCLEFSQNAGAANEYISAQLEPGTYYVVVEGNNGATSNYKLTVECATGNCNLNATLTPTNATCGQNNGSFNVHTTGGNPTYLISWTGPVSGNRSTQSNNTKIDELPSGTYKVTVTDKYGCKVEKEVVIGSGGNLSLQTTITNATCAQKGKVKVVVTNGTPSYKVYLSGAANETYTVASSTFTLEGLTPGNYQLYIVDVNGCSVSKDITIGQDGGNFSFTATPNAAACENPGSISIKTSNGSAPYKIFVTGPKNGSATSNNNNFTIDGLPGGTYTLKIVDAAGCSHTLTVTIPATNLVISTATIEGNCSQAGAIKVNISSGKPSFIISWDGPGNNDGSTTTSNTSHTIPNLPAGTYVIMVKDGNWCSVTKTVLLSGGASGFDIELAPTGGVCETPGSIGIDIIGGKAPYKVTWDGPGNNDGNTSTNNNWIGIPNLPTGTYTVTVKDANNCVINKTANVPVLNTTLSLTLSKTEGNCGQSSAIWVDVAGGTPIYKITWEGPVNGSANSNTGKHEIKDLLPGNYTIKVVDANWCTISKTITITGGAPGFGLELVPKKGVCETPGSIGVEISGGKAPYKITWDGPGNNDGNATANTTWFDIPSLPPGSYTVTVKDANGCTVIKTTQLQNPDSNLSLKATVTEGNCGQFASISIDIDGGTPIFKISWQGPNSGSTEINTDKYDIKNLLPGTYVVTVIDKNWCSVSKTLVITGSAPGFDIKLTPTNGICESPGSIKVTIEGGKAPYKISWDGPGNNDGNETSNGNMYEIDDLPAGNYTITVKDANNCSIGKTTQVSKLENSLSLKLTVTEGNCGQPSKILVDVDGGAPIYKISWDGPVDGEADSNSDKLEIKDLPAGTYTIKVFDKNWCAVSKTVVVTGGALGFDFKLTPTNGICESPGSIKVTIDGGKAPYKITWNGPSNNDGNTTINSTAYDIASLPEGSYTITIKDANNCEITKVVQVSKLENSLSLKLTVTEGNCGQPSKILVDVDGGAPIYKISWDGPVDGEADSNSDKLEIKDLPAGTYTIKVFDKNWCAVSKTVVVTGGALGFDFKLTPTSGICESPGSIKVTIEGGKAPYKITWEGPGSNDGNITVNTTTYDINSLPAGEYIVTVKDANNCVIAKTTQVSTGANNVTFVTTIKDANCLQSGSILVDVNGGTAPYTISWEGPSNNDGNTTINSDKVEIKDLIPGSYTIKVQDKNWCGFSKTVIIGGNTTGVDIALTPYSGVCESPGSIKVKINSGQAPFKISWEGPGSNDGNTTTNATTYDILNLPAGSYIVTVKDANNCVIAKTTQVTVGENSITFTTTVKDATCLQNGIISVDVNGGTGPYNLIVDGPGNNDANATVNSDKFELKNLIPGTYTIKVVDKNWCSFSKTVAVGGNTIGVDIVLTPHNGVCETPGNIKVKINSGQAPYKISWEGPGNNDGNATTSSNTYEIGALPAGTYIVTVKDANNCVISKTTQVAVTENALQIAATIYDGLCGQKGSIKVNITGGSPNYIIEWNGPVNGSQTVGSASYTIPNLPAGSYTIKVTDGNWCTTSKTVGVSSTPGNLFTATPTNGTCDAPGSIKLNLTSGTAPYTITWTGNGTPVMTTGATYVINALPAGNYTVKVTDAQGCMDTKTVTIHANQSNLNMEASLNIGNCGAASKVWIKIIGGTPKYKIAWQGPQNGSVQVNTNTHELSDLPAGKYTITITDANWCTVATMITVYHTSGELFKAIPTNGVCESPGSIKLNFVGGMPVYSISWTGPTPGAASTSENSFHLQNLSPGSYTIKVTDSKGCIETKTVTLGQNEGAVDFDASLIVNDCGQYNTIWLTIHTGMPTHTIKWDGPGSQDGSGTTNNGGFEIVNLLPGKYTVTVFDKNWCYADTMITIHPSTVNLFAAVASNGVCGQNGSIKVTFNGGMPNYDLKWEGPKNGNATVSTNMHTISDLPAGNYILTVKDAKGCTQKDTVTITNTEDLTAEINGTNSNCSTEGKIEVNIMTGTGPFAIIFSGMGITDTVDVQETGEVVLADLDAGNYKVTVKGTGTCVVTEDVTITATESALAMTTTPTNATCGTAGSVLLNISGGDAPYTVSWTGEGVNQTMNTNNGAFTIPSLQAGTYTVTVKDKNGCETSKSVKIVATESNLEVTATVTNGACGQTGQILVSATGGSGALTCTWSGPSNGTQTLTGSYTIKNLNSGTYNITVTDAAGCSRTKMVSVTNNNQTPVANFSFAINGMKVTFTNQSTPGTYQWNFGDQSTSTNNNPEHTYLNTGTFNVCLKVTNSCGVKDICKNVVLSPSEGVVNIDVEDGTGGTGEIIYIPVVVKNCVTNTLVSLAGSLQIENTNVGVITGILPGSITPQYSASNKTFSYYANNGSGVPCGAGQILFYVGVELKGNPGASTVLNIVNTPLPIEVGGLMNGNPSSVPHVVTGGLVSVQSIALVQGDVLTYWGDALPSVEISINSTASSKKDTTDNDGHYMVSKLQMGKEYTIQPKLDGNPANGLSTYALFAGQRFILGMEPAEITSPYQIIAGDANCDGRFSSLDLFIIQRLIIGTSETFDRCPSWVFVRAGDHMPVEFTATNVFPYHNCDTLMLMKDTVSNFIGIKVGDILGHANPALHNIDPRGLNVLHFVAENRAVRAGEVVEIQLTSDNFQQIASYQLGLSFDFNKLEFVETATDIQSPFAKMALNKARADEGILRLSWFDHSGEGVSTKAADQVFTLRFIALEDIDNLADLLELNSRTIPSEAYTVTAERMTIDLQFTHTPGVEPKDQVVTGYKLYQNIPNPFRQETLISFDLPENMQAELVVFDQLGRVVKTFSGNYNKGFNQVQLERNSLNAGVYYYTLRTRDFAQTKSMIIFE